MPLEATRMPRALPAPARLPDGSKRRAPFWRGAAGAVALAAWSVAGVVWAALALAPVALESGPRGRARARSFLQERSPRRLVPGRSPAGAEAEAPMPAARAAGEAFPG